MGRYVIVLAVTIAWIGSMVLMHFPFIAIVGATIAVVIAVTVVNGWRMPWRR